MNKSNLNLKETIYNAVLEGIFNYEYKPQQILNEKQLTEKYNCSKSPVREALISLCDENVLRSIPRYGYEVVKLTMEDVEDMLEFRYLLEGGLLKVNFTKFNQNQIEKLKELDEACSMPAMGVWEHWESNVSFHMQMMAFCKNDCAYNELQRIMNRLKRAYAQFYWNKWDSLGKPLDTKYHKDIIRCIEEKDAKNLLIVLRKDLMDFGNTHLELTEFF